MSRTKTSHLVRAALILSALSIQLSGTDLALAQDANAAGEQGGPESVDAPRIEVDGSALTITIASALPRRFELPCAPVARRLEPAPNHPGVHHLYLACSRRVLQLEIGASGSAIVGDIALPSEVTGSHNSGSELWLEFADGSARGVHNLRSAPAAAPAPEHSALAAPTPTRTPTPTSSPYASTPGVTAASAGRVTEVRAAARAFVIDLGSRDGLTAGDYVSVSSSERGPEHEVIGRVRATTDDSATVALAYDDAVEVGQRAQRTNGRVRSTPRHMGVWPYRASVRADFRPGLVLDGVGGNLQLDGEVMVHHGIGMFALRLASSGVSFAKRSPDYSPGGYEGDSGADFGFGGGYVLAGVDLGFLAVAGGVGINTLFHEADTRYVSGTGRVITTVPAGHTPTVTLPFRLRLGREDRFYGEVTQLIGYTESKLKWLGVEVRGQVPAGPIWIFADVAAGLFMPFHGIIGARVALSGNGEPGSLLMRVGAGISGTINETEAETTRVGPALQAGLERRF